MDGTIADTDKVIVKSYLELYKIYRPDYKPSIKKIKTFSGPPLNETLSKEFPNLELDFIKKEYKRISKQNYIKYLKTFRFCKEFLEILKEKGYKISIATSKIEEGTHFSLKLLNFEHLFDFIVCADTIDVPKPAPNCVFKIMDHYGISKEETLFVGDTHFDYKCARAAGVNVAIMTFMKRVFNEDFNPDSKSNSFKKLLKYIENYGK
jgi:pyrophosphatase PpaX